ncbi:hypothetical protein UFOVP347_49 [uncultured Caudovirales phage]|uniref:Uncharacterized protein n=1 Tax=uncultured Caudovirales phage TaxID=2100421 RepID=A0A6J5M2M5_9CAUD|nr:hypothetical protein UFOVP347_49 [uncultured Caudovirales phage]
MSNRPTTIAALYVEPQGSYINAPGVDPWDEARDARAYRGPHPVVAHPPCQRWGRFWHGSPMRPHVHKLGDDGGCFREALHAVRTWGGVLEHPADSKAWDAFGLIKPKRHQGWTDHDANGGRSCYVEQGHYGHVARKATWLYAVGTAYPELTWGPCEQRLHPGLLAKYGYAYARRAGMIGVQGGKDKTAKRNHTPPAFRDLLLTIARSAA